MTLSTEWFSINFFYCVTVKTIYTLSRYTNSIPLSYVLLTSRLLQFILLSSHLWQQKRCVPECFWVNFLGMKAKYLDVTYSLCLPLFFLEFFIIEILSHTDYSFITESVKFFIRKLTLFLFNLYQKERSLFNSIIIKFHRTKKMRKG